MMRKLSETDPIATANESAIEAIRQAVPEAWADGRFDFDVLRQFLGGSVAEGDERFGLNWYGKRRARQTALMPSGGALRPCPDQSLDWDSTRNVIIEGDNLEVLKILQKSYAGRIKLIFIDPPYNTGKDFIYPDKFSESIKGYLELVGEISDGKKLSSNTETSGRFHTAWLNMMYPRLRIAKDLLREDGSIFITIDDTEMANLKLMCDEIFGEENFLAAIAWQKTYSPANDKKGIDAMHDTVLAYGKSPAFNVNLLPRTAKQDDAYSNPDNDERGPWKAVDATRAEHRDYAFYPIQTPRGNIVEPATGRSWVFTKEELPGLIEDKRLWFGKNGDSKPSKKLFLSEVKQGIVPTTWWSHEDAGHNDQAKKELKDLFPDGLPFLTPKPAKLIRRIGLIATGSHEEDIVLDFFAGSGTTGQAVMELNNEDRGNRRFFLVQMPWPTGDETMPSISDVTAERVRRAGSKIVVDVGTDVIDSGFRFFKLDSTNIREWDVDPDELESALFEATEHLKSGRSQEDILFEILLRLGLDLNVSIEKKLIATKEVHVVAGAVLSVCLEPSIKAGEVESLGLGIVHCLKEYTPAGDTTCVFRDSAFENDNAKTNMTLILEQHGVVNVRSL